MSECCEWIVCYSVVLNYYEANIVSIKQLNNPIGKHFLSCLFFFIHNIVSLKFREFKQKIDFFKAKNGFIIKIIDSLWAVSLNHRDIYISKMFGQNHGGFKMTLFHIMDI